MFRLLQSRRPLRLLPESGLLPRTSLHLLSEEIDQVARARRLIKKTKSLFGTPSSSRGQDPQAAEERQRQSEQRRKQEEARRQREQHQKDVMSRVGAAHEKLKSLLRPDAPKPQAAPAKQKLPTPAAQTQSAPFISKSAASFARGSSAQRRFSGGRKPATTGTISGAKVMSAATKRKPIAPWKPGSYHKFRRMSELPPVGSIFTPRSSF